MVSNESLFFSSAEWLGQNSERFPFHKTDEIPTDVSKFSSVPFSEEYFFSENSNLNTEIKDFLAFV
jgi:hypothetical protein